MGAWNNQASITFDEYYKWAKKYNWDLFLTLTFGKKTGKNLAKEKFRKWIRAVENHEGKAGKTSFYVSVEFNKAGAHIHALANNVEDLEFARSWWQNNCGKCKIDVYDKAKDGVGYVTKVIYKGGTPDPWGPIWKGA